MNRTRVLSLLCLLVPLSAGTVACGAAGDADTSETEDAFSGSDTQNLGTLAYGQARDVSYTSTPRYRAFTFQGTAGDKVDVTVSSNDASPLAWVLTENFGYIAKGDANDGSGHATHVTTTLKKSGAYLVLFRAYSTHDASFHVELGNALPPPTPDGDVFDPNYCDGPSISSSEFLARFSHAETQAKLGDVQLRVRQRQCQDQTGCEDWTDASSVPFYVVTYVSGRGYTTSNPTQIAVPAKGSADISVGSNTMGINLSLASTPSFALGDSTNTSASPSFDFRMPTLNNQSVQVGSWLRSAGNYQSFSQKKITGTCVQALSGGRVYDANGRYVEYTASIAGKYAAKAPDPTPDTPKGDVYDPAWCSGPAMTQSEFLAKFAPAATHAELGRVTLEARQRSCQDQTGCQAWHSSSKVPLYVVTYVSGRGYTTSNPTDIALPASGPIDLNVGSNTMAINLGLDGTSFALGDSTNTSNPPSFDFRMPTLNNQSVQVGSWLRSPGNYQSFSQKTLTNSCLQALSGGRVYDANGQYIEYAASLHAQY